MPNETAIRQVRAFNRTVVERIGALDDEYLARARPLGASRVLWEVDASGTDARSIRTRLGLDSGYLSRLLRSLEGDGLIDVEPDPDDQRVRRVRLTRAGRTERDELDRRSDALAWSLLEPLDEHRRTELVSAMNTVARLLTTGVVDVAIEDPTSASARFCLTSYFEELDRRFDAGFDPAASLPFDVQQLVEPAGALLVARLRGEPVGCGAVRFNDAAPADIKRMWVASAARGLGIGRRILGQLEDLARGHGATAARLETNRSLGEAIRLYRSAGYVEVAAFNDERYGDHWFEKRL